MHACTVQYALYGCVYPDDVHRAAAVAAVDAAVRRSRHGICNELLVIGHAGQQAAVAVERHAPHLHARMHAWTLRAGRKQARCLQLPACPTDVHTCRARHGAPMWQQTMVSSPAQACVPYCRCAAWPACAGLPAWSERCPPPPAHLVCVVAAERLHAGACGQVPQLDLHRASRPSSSRPALD